MRKSTRETLERIELRCTALQDQVGRIELRAIDLQNRDPNQTEGRWNEIMATLAEVQAADDELDAQVGRVLSAVSELRTLVVQLQDQVAAGVSPADLEPIVAELNRKSAQIEAALSVPSES